MLPPPEVVEAYARVRDDGGLFVRRLWIQNERQKLVELNRLWPEQEAWLEALLAHRFVIGLKPRQVGFTTITTAFLWWKVLTSPNARRVLQMVNHEDTRRRLVKMLRVFLRTMPPELRPEVSANNDQVMEFVHNEGGFDRVLAGGGGEGRGWTYTDLHATEMAKWKRRTAANSSDDGSPTTESTWGSALATMHDPLGHVIVESTGLPGGLFEHLWTSSAREPDDPSDPHWHRVFVPWSQVPRYQRPLNDAQALRLERSLTDEERRLQREYGLTLPQLAWRRDHTVEIGVSNLHFRREYPLSPLDPFRLAESNWFDQDVLAAMAAMVPELGRQTNPPLRVFHEYNPRHRYILAGDTAGGTGRDEACGQVLRDDGQHAATWASRWASPTEQGEQFARMSALFGGALAIIEANKYGTGVIEHLAARGVNLWKDADGNDFHTSGGIRWSSKREVMVHARNVFDGYLTAPQDLETVTQAQRVVEKPAGKIEGAGDTHDDRIFTYCLGLWALRDYDVGTTDAFEAEVERHRQIAQLPERWGAFDGFRR